MDLGQIKYSAGSDEALQHMDSWSPIQKNTEFAQGDTFQSSKPSALSIPVP